MWCATACSSGSSSNHLSSSVYLVRLAVTRFTSVSVIRRLFVRLVRNLSVFTRMFVSLSVVLLFVWNHLCAATVLHHCLRHRIYSSDAVGHCQVSHTDNDKRGAGKSLSLSATNTRPTSSGFHSSSDLLTCRILCQFSREGVLTITYLRLNFIVVTGLTAFILARLCTTADTDSLHLRVVNWQRRKELNPVLVGWSHSCYRNTSPL